MDTDRQGRATATGPWKPEVCDHLGAAPGEAGAAVLAVAAERTKNPPRQATLSADDSPHQQGNNQHTAMPCGGIGTGGIGCQQRTPDHEAQRAMDGGEKPADGAQVPAVPPAWSRSARDRTKCIMATP